MECSGLDADPTGSARVVLGKTSGLAWRAVFAAAAQGVKVPEAVPALATSVANRKGAAARLAAVAGLVETAAVSVNTYGVAAFRMLEGSVNDNSGVMICATGVAV